MSAILSKDTKLEFKRSTDAEWIIATGLRSVPAIKGSRDQVEVTDLSHGSKQYIQGLRDAGEIAMTFTYENTTSDSPYRVFRVADDDATSLEFKLTLPDGLSIAFGAVPCPTLDDIEPNSDITFTCSFALTSEPVETNGEY